MPQFKFYFKKTMAADQPERINVTTIVRSLESAPFGEHYAFPEQLQDPALHQTLMNKKTIKEQLKGIAVHRNQSGRERRKAVRRWGRQFRVPRRTSEWMRKAEHHTRPAEHDVRRNRPAVKTNQWSGDRSGQERKNQDPEGQGQLCDRRVRRHIGWSWIPGKIRGWMRPLAALQVYSIPSSTLCSPQIMLELFEFEETRSRTKDEQEF